MIRKLFCLMLLLAATGVAMPGPAFAESQPVVIGSTNFPEQLIVANIYAKVLEARGISVEKRLNLGTREIVFPALEAGEIDLLPEYTGAVLSYLTKGHPGKQTDQTVLKALRKHLPDGIVALDPSPAEDKDTLVVTQATADKYQLETMSDLAPVASKLIMGGPPEDKTRYVGLRGLQEVYGVQFKNFRSLDPGGPLTTAALDAGSIDVARMFTTQGIIQAKGWVVLKDDKHLVAGQHLIPIMREAVRTKAISKALNSISQALTTEQLQAMNKRVMVDKVAPETVAETWVEQHQLGQ